MADTTIRLPDEAALTGKYVRAISKTINGTLVHEHVYIAGGLTYREDVVGGGVSYVGQAAPGSSTASAVWRIIKITETSTTAQGLWANASDEFNQIWDNRLILVYS